MLGVTSEDEIEVQKIANLLHEFLKQKIINENAKILLYKPVPSPIEKIKNKFRWRIITVSYTHLTLPTILRV